MSKAEFTQEFGAVYEHSKWMAEHVYGQHLTADDDNANRLVERFNSVFLDQDKETQLGVINAHPDLAGKLAIDNNLTHHSTHEQQSAGLDQCSTLEFEKFTLMNKRYKKKFDFPFIKAVKRQTRESILIEFEDRINNSYENEFNKALTEINNIAAFRLQDWFVSHHGVNLASANDGAQVIAATDNFIAIKQRLLKDEEASFTTGNSDDQGKRTDAFEPRHKGETGHDFCIIKLAKSGQINIIEIDTTFFAESYAPWACIDASADESDPQADAINWQQIFATESLQGNKKHYYEIEDTSIYSHIKLNIYPYGAVSRFRVLGFPNDD